MSCPHLDTEFITKLETYPVLNDSITISANVKICKDCNKELFDIETDTKNIIFAYRVYKKRHNLLQSEEIVALRERLNLSQIELANLLQCTKNEVIRFEHGCIQTREQNNKLLALRNTNKL